MTDLWWFIVTFEPRHPLQNSKCRMLHQMTPIDLNLLADLSLKQIRQGNFMGIPESLFYKPAVGDIFLSRWNGSYLEAPLGVAAGPQTQLSQNIVAAWLCGARFIELKTVQVLDDLEVSKPCIDMYDEGYNCEWSQELTIGRSVREYLKGWILIHMLHRELGFQGSPGVVFNMSVGYDLKGIMGDKVQWFLDKMADCTDDLTEARNQLRHIYPAIDRIEIPSRLAQGITLSTMHGCPPGEIGQIGRYLLSEKRLHTTIKLNPTLLGAEHLRELLSRRLKFDVDVPDAAFDHDLKYPDALKIIDSLTSLAAECEVEFSVKLTNTLECVNKRGVFNSREKMAYLSGRALHPIGIALARKLKHDRPALPITFSGGVDCFNIADVVSCGLRPVTVCTDLLKPGGYGRFHQYYKELQTEFGRHNAGNTGAFILSMARMRGFTQGDPELFNLDWYSNYVCDQKAYQKMVFTEPSIKTPRPLGWFDCIHAPCTDTCPASQDIPGYLGQVADGEPKQALKTIVETNPFPTVTGMICDHQCQFKCTRINYDESLQIREVKRFAAEQVAGIDRSAAKAEPSHHHKRVAIIGAGPAGLSCAWYLRQAGFAVDVYEQHEIAGGMVARAIPSFRLTSGAVDDDIRRILDAGIRLHTSHEITREEFERLQRDYDAIFLGAGAQETVALDIPGIGSEGVVEPLQLLTGLNSHRVLDKKGGTAPDRDYGIGRHVVIIGGGNTAMDVARSAKRVVPPGGSVTIVYRRTIREMPADKGEIGAVLAEGITIIELASPERVIASEGRVSALVCSKNTLQPGTDRFARPHPVRIAGSEFEIACDTIIPAIGQRLSVEFLEPGRLKTTPGNYKTSIPKLYTGGDAMRGASTAINAIADGRKAASEIISDCTETLDHLNGVTADGSDEGREPGNAIASDRNNAGAPGFTGVQHAGEELHPAANLSRQQRLDRMHQLIFKKAQRQYSRHHELPVTDNSRGFVDLPPAFTKDEAVAEAARCLSCDELCNSCVTVCPNLANFAFFTEPRRFELLKAIRGADGSVTFHHDCIFRIDQPVQILHIRDLCNSCGNCTTFCPSSGSPFIDKPALCLSHSAFEQEEEAFWLQPSDHGPVLYYKSGGVIRTLTLNNGVYDYHDGRFTASIQQEGFRLLEVRFTDPSAEMASVAPAARMSLIREGALQFYGIPLQPVSEAFTKKPETNAT